MNQWPIHAGGFSKIGQAFHHHAGSIFAMFSFLKGRSSSNVTQRCLTDKVEAEQMPSRGMM